MCHKIKRRLAVINRHRKGDGKIGIVLLNESLDYYGIGVHLSGENT